MPSQLVWTLYPQHLPTKATILSPRTELRCSVAELELIRVFDV